MTQKFHKLWLKVTAIVVGSSGPILFLGTMMYTSEPARWTLDVLSWPVDGLQDYLDLATKQSIPHKTAEGYITKFVEACLIHRDAHNTYVYNQ